MYIENPAVIPISVLDFAQFTNGQQGMDLVDITYMGKLSQNVSSPLHVVNSQATVSAGSTTAFNDPRKSIIENPGSYVYRLDLTLDSDKLVGSEVEGISVEISPSPFGLFISSDYEDIENLSNKALIIAKELNSKASTETLEVMIDYRSDFNAASNKNLAEASQEKSGVMEQKVFFSSADKSTLAQNKIPIIASFATSPKVSIDNMTLESQINSAITAGLDPFASIVSNNAHTSLESKFSLGNNDVFDFEEDAVRIKSQITIGETSLSSIRASNMAAVFESRGYSESSKEAQRLADFLSDFDEPKDKIQLGLIGTITTKKFRVIRDIEIPKRIIGTDNQFYVRMTPIVKSQGTTDAVVEPASFDFVVAHKAQVMHMVVPVVPPSVSIAENSSNKINLKINNNDPTGREMTITRKVYDPRTKSFTRHKTAKTLSGIYPDRDLPNIAPNKVYYSVCMIDQQGAVGPSTSLVVDGVENVNCTSKENDQSIKLYAVNRENGIKITLENIPADVKIVRVMREHRSGIGDFSQKLSVIGDVSSFNIETSKSRSISVFDGAVADGHEYRYFAVCKERRGLGYTTEDDDIIIRKFPRKPLPYDVYCGDPSVISTDPKFLIGIELSVAHKKENYEFFLRLLKNSGADKQFLDEIKRNRKYLSDVIAFNIDRIDVLTGKKVNLGLRGPGVFMDGAGHVNSPEKLKPGRKYVYIIRVCVKPVQGFFARLFSGLTNPNQTSGTDITTYMTKKFVDSANRFLGALPSDSEIREGGNPAHELIAADTGLTFTKTLQTAKLRASVVDFKQTPSPFTRDDSLRLTFRLSGGPKEEVLKALIYCKTKSGRKCIGELSVDPNADLYYFNDKIKYRDVGTKTYSVKLVYTDLKTSSHSTELVFKKENSILPSFVGSKMLETRY